MKKPFYYNNQNNSDQLIPITTSLYSRICTAVAKLGLNGYLNAQTSQ